MSVSQYFTQLKFLWDELGSIVSISPCICGNAKKHYWSTKLGSCNGVPSKTPQSFFSHSQSNPANGSFSFCPTHPQSGVTGRETTWAEHSLHSFGWFCVYAHFKADPSIFNQMTMPFLRSLQQAWHMISTCYRIRFMDYLTSRQIKQNHHQSHLLIHALHLSSIPSCLLSCPRKKLLDHQSIWQVMLLHL